MIARFSATVPSFMFDSRQTRAMPTMIMSPSLKNWRRDLPPGFLEEEIAWLAQFPGSEEMQKQLRRDGGPKPSARWLRERLRVPQREREKKYKQAHPEKTRASRRQSNAKWRDEHKEEFDELRLSRPFVCIDSEGQDYEGDDEWRDGVLYKNHGTYLWCASTGDPAQASHILVDPLTNGTDKRKLYVKTILDRLLSLPSKYEPLRIDRKKQGGAIFIMFGSGYEFTQILTQTNLKTAQCRQACRLSR
jgi:hypothetical protein